MLATRRRESCGRASHPARPALCNPQEIAFRPAFGLPRGPKRDFLCRAGLQARKRSRTDATDGIPARKRKEAADSMKAGAKMEQVAFSCHPPVLCNSLSWSFVASESEHTICPLCLPPPPARRRPNRPRLGRGHAPRSPRGNPYAARAAPHPEYPGRSGLIRALICAARPSRRLPYRSPISRCPHRKGGARVETMRCHIVT